MTTKYKIVLSVGLVALLAAGCNKTTTPATNSTTNSTDQQSTTQSSTNTNDNMDANMEANMNTNLSANTNISNTNTTAMGKASVTIKGMAFNPGTTTIKKGTMVTWTNQDTASHTVTGDNGGPNSSALTTGQSYSFTFDTVGTFNYHCSIHPSMKATVIVTE